MTDWILSIEGTEEGRRVALILAMIAAVLHAAFGALQKGRHDPWISRGVIDFSYFLLALPVCLFVVPWPEPQLWPILAGAFVIHVVYKYLQAAAYERAPYTVVYPVVRGLAPLVTVLGAGLVFSETYTPVQWTGILVLTLAIMELARRNLRSFSADIPRLRAALFFSALTGVMVAVYTTYDAYGIRATFNPFTFIFWFFVIDGMWFPVIAWKRWSAMTPRPAVGPLALRGAAGAVIGLGSFGSIMMATRLDKVGEAAVLRETSTIFAALIGWVFLREKVGPVRGALIALIAVGAVTVEFGG